MGTIIKNGILVTPTDTFKADLKIENGTIKMIADQISPDKADEVIDAEGQFVLPGAIDPHTHLAIDNTLDDFESGTQAAAVGGITSIINYTDPKKGQSYLENLKEWKQKAEPSIIDYSFHSIINTCDETVLEEMPRLTEEGVTSYKLFMAYRGTNMVDDRQIYALMKKASELGMVTNVHAENGDVIDNLIHEALSKGNTDPIYHAYTRPPASEAEATNRALRIAEVLNAPIYIAHVSCEEALNEIKAAKARGVTAFAETCPQYLVLTDDYLKKENSESVKYICSPPLRTLHDQHALWGGITANALSTIGSDHASHPYINGKELGINDFTKAPNGLPGLENAIPLLYHFGVHEKRISIQKFVEITSYNPSRIFGMYPNKGSLNIGSDADIVILNPRKQQVITRETQVQNTEYNVYEGFKIMGSISHVLSRGKLIVKDKVVIGKPGHGKFIYRKKFNQK